MKLTKFGRKPLKGCALEENGKRYYLQYCDDCKYKGIDDCTRKRIFDILQKNKNEEK